MAINHTSDIDVIDFMKIYKNNTTLPYSFLVILLMRAYNFNKNKITRSFMLLYFI